MEKRPIEVPLLSEEDFGKLLAPNLIYPGLSELFGHYSRTYLKQLVGKMNSYTWFRFVEAESKSLIFKKMATRVLYKMLGRKETEHYFAGNENGYLIGENAVGLTSLGVNYKIINEDGAGIFERENELLMVVCDGVGDCLVGEVASYVIMEAFRLYPQKQPSEIFAHCVEQLVSLGTDLTKEIPEFITFPNEVSQAAVTAVKIEDNQCEISQVGDVIFYHHREGDLRLLDQNRRWLDLEQLDRLFADEHYLSQRHIISNAIGRNYDPDWLPSYLTLKPGDTIVLASDGLETLHPGEVQDILNRNAPIEETAEHFYRRVIEANLRWNTVGSPIYTKPDNISLIVYRHEPDA